jgi:hypothetical protein
MLLFVAHGTGHSSENCVVAGLSNRVHPNLTPAELKKYGIHQSRGPMHPTYNTGDARLRSYESWPRSLKQKPDKLSEAGFYYTGKSWQLYLAFGSHIVGHDLIFLSMKLTHVYSLVVWGGSLFYDTFSVTRLMQGSKKYEGAKHCIGM